MLNNMNYSGAFNEVLGKIEQFAMSSYLAFIKNDNEDEVAAAFGKNNEDEILGIGKALYLYAKYKGALIKDIEFLKNELTL